MNRHTAISAMLAALLAACGGSGSSDGASPPGTSAAQVTRGTITSVSAGSLVVNGIAFSTSAATKVRIEKTERPESELRRGMVVRVEGSHQNRQGQASEVEFEDHVRGRVRSRTSTPDDTSVDVGGRRVHIEDSTRVVDDNGVDLGPSDIGPDDRVRVSGFADDRGNFRATSVERQARGSSDDSFEAKGFVYGLGAGRTAFTLASTPTATSGVAVTLGAGLTLAPAIAEGSFVEVHSTSSLSAGGSVVADRVQLEDSSLGGSGSEVEVEGIVTSGSAADFVVAGQRVTTSGSTRWEFGTAADFALGVKVEAEGHLDSSGTLAAEKVSYRYNVKIEAPVTVAAGGALSALGLPVAYSSELTRVEDAPVDGGTFEIRGYVRRNAAGDVTGVFATRIRSRSSGGGGGGGGTRYLWQGPVDAKDGTSTLTILGVVVTTTGASFRDHKQNDGDPDVVLSRDAFFAKVVAGQSVVKARIQAAPAGTPLTAPADELEIEDEPSPHR